MTIQTHRSPENTWVTLLDSRGGIIWDVERSPDGMTVVWRGNVFSVLPEHWFMP